MILKVSVYKDDILPMGILIDTIMGVRLIDMDDVRLYMFAEEDALRDDFIKFCGDKRIASNYHPRRWLWYIDMDGVTDADLGLHFAEFDCGGMIIEWIKHELRGYRLSTFISNLD